MYYLETRDIARDVHEFYMEMFKRVHATGKINIKTWNPDIWAEVETKIYAAYKRGKDSEYIKTKDKLYEFVFGKDQ